MQSHLAPGTITSSDHQVPAPASLSREPLSPPSLRAQVSTARRDCGRVGIALRLRRACSRSSSATARAKGSSGRQVVSASACTAQGHCWPSGRSGAGWGRSQGLPWVGGGLGGALRRQGRRASRAGDFSAPTPPGLQVPKVRPDRVGVLKSVTFTELCSFDSESSEKKILLIEYVFILRSSNPFDGWLCLPPPGHALY